MLAKTCKAEPFIVVWTRIDTRDQVCGGERKNLDCLPRFSVLFPSAQGLTLLVKPSPRQGRRGET
jgi:hypothetical protein